MTSFFKHIYIASMKAEATRSASEPAYIATLVGLITIELLAVAALHRLGRLPGLTIDWHHLSGWLISGGVEDVLAASLRLVAQACAYWLLLTTILYVIARLTHLPAAVRAVQWATLPAMRRLADRALAVALVGSTVTGGAGAAWASTATPCGAPLVVLGAGESPLPPGVQPPPPPLEVPCPPPFDGRPSFELPPLSVPSSDIASPPLVAPPAPPTLLVPPNVAPPPLPRDGVPEGHGVSREAPVVVEATGRPVEEVHLVVRGDNLWRIAASALRRAHDREVSHHEISTSWRLVVQANRRRLRSGDPDLIFPGEQVLLPSPEGGSTPAAGPRG
ncbi:MAG: LysM peptidoglycan-binding domain-containing protein [Nitriliruptorales bacterium]